LGGVAPVLRCEALYQFDNTFFTNGKAANPATDKEDFEDYDAVHWGMGIDWKFRFRLLNPTHLISITPQFSHKYVLDYPSDYKLMDAGGAPTRENNYDIGLMLNTWYLHEKLFPFVFYQRTIKGSVKSDRWLFKLTYSPNERWSFGTTLYLLEKKGYEAINHKDNISFTVKYQF
jgi:hypothetical protein